MDHPIFTSDKPACVVAKALSPNERGSFKHSNRVKRKALSVGRELGLEAYGLSLLRISAQWHDIGKFMDEKSRKLFFEQSGKFTKEETVEAEEHAINSGRVFQQYWQRFVPEMEMVRPIAIIIVGHHWPFNKSEKLYQQLITLPDFTYPAFEVHEQLSDFPLLGMRILKVVDCYQGQIEKRHYKLGRDQHDTMQEMVGKAGEEFDPVVLKAFEKVLYAELRKKLGIQG